MSGFFPDPWLPVVSVPTPCYDPPDIMQFQVGECDIEITNHDGSVPADPTPSDTEQE